MEMKKKMKDGDGDGDGDGFVPNWKAMVNDPMMIYV